MITSHEQLKAAEQLAQRFHDEYERLAPLFGYKTRVESSVPWENVPEENKNLMIAVSHKIMEVFLAGLQECMSQRGEPAFIKEYLPGGIFYGDTIRRLEEKKSA